MRVSEVGEGEARRGAGLAVDEEASCLSFGSCRDDCGDDRADDFDGTVGLGGSRVTAVRQVVQATGAASSVALGKIRGVRRISLG